MPPRILVVGAAGVFGRRVARELAAAASRPALLLCGRSRERLDLLAAELGGGDAAQVALLDATDDASCARAIEGANVVVHAAGPFQQNGAILARACARAGVSYLDLSDARGLYGAVEELGPAFAARGASATSGASTIPAVTGALVEAALPGFESVSGITSAFFVGNDNEKGDATIESVLRMAGPRIPATRGGREVQLEPLQGPLSLEFPFGDRPTFRIDAPDYDLWARLLPRVEVDVRAALERPSLRAGLRLARLLGLSSGWGARFAARVGRAFAGRDGTSGGAVRVELRGFAGGRPVRAVGFVWRSEDGQALVSAPAVAIALAMAAGQVPPGFTAPFHCLGPGGLLRALAVAGLVVERPELLPA